MTKTLAKSRENQRNNPNICEIQKLKKIQTKPKPHKR